ncbi:MAG: hypothetical protein AB1724_17575 [Thermodesulfobacteriota bacterium]
MDFLDPNKPIATCVSEGCTSCPAREKVHCHFTFKDVASYYLIIAPTLLLGGAGIYHASGWWLIVSWLLIIIGCFSFVLTRVLCSHCPHYVEAGSSLKCRANYGSPKIWKYRPGPMTFWEKVVFFAGFAIVWGYPLLFMIIEFQLFLLIVYLVASSGFLMTLKTNSCTQCMNFACPMNAVPDKVREDFFERNPGVAEAWHVDAGRVGKCDFIH